MYAYQIESWTGFLSVAAGVAATLTGLIFVAVSINLSRILEVPRIANRAAESILQMFGALLISMCALVPGLSSLVLGVEVALIGLMLWIMVTMLQYRAFAREFPRPLISIALAQVATVSILLCGNLDGDRNAGRSLLARSRHHLVDDRWRFERVGVAGRNSAVIGGRVLRAALTPPRPNPRLGSQRC